MKKLELQFKTDAERDYFIGQLFDGLCENHFDSKFVGVGRDVIAVKPVGEFWEHAKRMRKMFLESK